MSNEKTVWWLSFQQLDQRIVHFMAKYGVTLLRWTLAITFIWFGALKIFGLSPVGDLVAMTVPWLPSEFFVPFLGVVEVVIGLGLLTRLALRFILLLFFAQMVGTFLVLLLLPSISFQGGNPLLLSYTGEFVVKNFVLLSAGMVIGSTVRRSAEKMPER